MHDLKSTVGWVTKPCSLEKAQQQVELIFPPASAGFLLSVLFDPEDGGDVCLENVGILRITCHYNPEDPTLHIHRSENLTYNKT
jgi:hypothetical protein